MDSTIMDSTGNGVLYDSPFGSSALGMGGRPGAARPILSSSSSLLLHRAVKLDLRWL